MFPGASALVWWWSGTAIARGYEEFYLEKLDHCRKGKHLNLKEV